jgi:hypothetical protein
MVESIFESKESGLDARSSPTASGRGPKTNSTAQVTVSQATLLIYTTVLLEVIWPSPLTRHFPRSTIPSIGTYSETAGELPDCFDPLGLLAKERGLSHASF